MNAQRAQGVPVDVAAEQRDKARSDSELAKIFDEATNVHVRIPEQPSFSSAPPSPTKSSNPPTMPP
eukprot:7348723-Karenia_brevis.AAC.1